MDVIRIKLQHYNIEWDGPIIFIKDDSVTVLSPFQILQFVEGASRQVKHRIYAALDSLRSRKATLNYLEKLGAILLSIKL